MLGKLFLAASQYEVEIGLGQGLSYALLGVSIVFAALFALMIVIKIMGVINEKATAPKAQAPAAPAPAPAAAAPAAPAPVVKTEPKKEAPALKMPAKTAAMLIATVADAMGCEPEELRFESIKRVPTGGKIVDGMELTNTDEKTAAMIMAIVADEMGCEPDELVFNSIKRV